MTPEQEQLLEILSQIYPPETREELPGWLKKSIIQVIIGRYVKPTFCDVQDPIEMARTLLELEDKPGNSGSVERDLRSEWFFHNRRRTVRARR